MDVLSLFDGMSCGQIALERAEVKVDNYFASETDKYAIEVTQKNYSNTIQIGDVEGVQYYKNSLLTRNGSYNNIKIGLLIGGSPCQGFSFAGKQLHFDDPRSKLFFEYVRVLKELRSINPDVLFLLENVVMKKEWEQIITDTLGIEPIKINSRLFSAQNRPRLYWTNISVDEPIDKCITLAEVLEENVDLKYKLSDAHINRVLNTKRGRGFFYTKEHKYTGTLISGYHKQPTDGIYVDLGFKRRLTPTECERLQTVPNNYTDCVSNTQRYKMLGNGWTVDAIAHIFKNIK